MSISLIVDCPMAIEMIDTWGRVYDTVFHRVRSLDRPCAIWAMILSCDWSCPWDVLRYITLTIPYWLWGDHLFATRWRELGVTYVIRAIECLSLGVSIETQNRGNCFYAEWSAASDIGDVEISVRFLKIFMSNVGFAIDIQGALLLFVS